MNGQDNEEKTNPVPDPVEDPAAGPAEGKGEGKGILSEHKGKLAIGVAATLGLMVYYNWRQKNLSKDDPEGYARLQRLKDSLKASEHQEKNSSPAKKSKSSDET